MRGLPEAIEGSIDGLVDGCIGGWARDLRSPLTRLEIELAVDGDTAGRIVADELRDDLAASGVGDGRYGFLFRLPEEYLDGERHEVTARPTGTDLRLNNSPLVIRTDGDRRQAAGRPGPFAADTVLAREGSVDALRAALASAHGGGTLAVVAAYRPAGAPAGYARRYVAALRALGFAVLVVDTTPKGRAGDWDGLAHMVMRRRDGGWDFASWLAGIDATRDLLAEADQLLLANDSVFGPLFPLAETFSHPAVADADVWGITDSWAYSYHLQSYFLVLRATAARSDAFWRFLERYPFPMGKRAIVRDGEIGLSRALLGAGLKVAATCPYEDVARTWLDDLPEYVDRLKTFPDVAERITDWDALDPLKTVLRTAQQVRRGIPQNSMHLFWDTLVRRFRCPFLKRDLVLTNPAEIPNVFEVRRVLSESTDYPVEIITELARTVRDPRVAVL